MDWQQMYLETIFFYWCKNVSCYNCSKKATTKERFHMFEHGKALYSRGGLE